MTLSKVLIVSNIYIPYQWDKTGNWSFFVWLFVKIEWNKAYKVLTRCLACSNCSMSSKPVWIESPGFQVQRTPKPLCHSVIWHPYSQSIFLWCSFSSFSTLQHFQDSFSDYLFYTHVLNTTWVHVWPLLLLHVFYSGTLSSFHDGFNYHQFTGD